MTAPKPKRPPKISRRDFCFDTFFQAITTIVGENIAKTINEHYTDLINEHDKKAGIK